MGVGAILLGNSNINTDRKRVRGSIFILLAIFTVGLILCKLIINSALNSTNIRNNSFLVLFVRNEVISLLLLFLFVLLLGQYLLSSDLLSFWPRRPERIWEKLPNIWILALGVVLIGWQGDIFILHKFPLSNDEYLPRFQAQIFAAGRIKATLAPSLREFAKALTPIFAIYDPQGGTWTSSYLPVYAVLRTGFLALGIESLTNPVLAGVSLILLASVAKRIWIQESSAPLVAVILLASSSQFLVTSMTSYAMPAHLGFNLAWLYFYGRKDRLGNLVTPWIGFFALGLHNPFVHALFVTPFLISMLWESRVRLTCYFYAVYAGACVVWFIWWTEVSRLPGDTLRTFQFPGYLQMLIQPMNLAMLVSWQCLAASFLVILALKYWARLTPFLRLMAWGCLLTFGFYFFYPYDQVLGWGYRFFYGVLGNFVLLATAGWYRVKEILGLKKAWGFVLLGIGIAIFVQFPLRCLQVESFVRPFAKSAQYIRSLPKSFVLINPNEVWYAQLLVRNDPYLRNHPKFLFSQKLTEEQKEKLETLGDVYQIKPEELSRFGMHAISRSFEKQY